MNFNPTQRDDYMIIAALRGPDSASDFALRCKQIFTARLRHFIGMKIVCEADVRDRPIYRESDLAFLFGAAKGEPWFAHWAYHVGEGLGAIWHLETITSREAGALLDILYALCSYVETGLEPDIPTLFAALESAQQGLPYQGPEDRQADIP